MSPVIRLVPNLPAILVIVRRHRTGEVLVLANADEPWRLIFNVARALLPRHERRELLRALVVASRLVVSLACEGGR